jgi:ribosomal-protein-alanine N-acetyltransferase
MTEDDLFEVVAIEQEAYPFPWSQQIFRDCLRVGYCCWVLESLQTIEGYGILAVGAGESHLLNLCVRRCSQGRGLGRNLLMHLLQIARDHHADTLYLEVRPSNRTALKLYHSLGFNKVGMRRAYYPAEWGREDALILGLTLSLEGNNSP